MYTLQRYLDPVSTHSRLEAAELDYLINIRRNFGFNTQPPRGG